MFFLQSISLLSKRNMCKVCKICPRRVPTYLDVYNRYAWRAAGDDLRIEDLLWKHLRELQSQCLRRQYATLRHLHRAATTQQLFSSLSQRSLDALARQRHLAELQMRLRLRSMQWRVLQHLWRPNATLMKRQALAISL